MAQTAYVAQNAPGIAGMLADNSPMRIISKLAQGIVTVGTLVAPGTDSYTGLEQPGSGDAASGQLPATLLDSQWAGIAMFDSTLPPYTVAASMTVGGYQDKDPVSVVRIGRIWVVTETATTEWHDVYVRNVTGTGTQIKGNFRDGAAAGFSLLPRARFRSTSAAGLAVVELW